MGDLVWGSKGEEWWLLVLVVKVEIPKYTKLALRSSWPRFRLKPNGAGHGSLKREEGAARKR